ncbi:MAG: CPBP family intramembrane glutamic endopeptidase [Nitrososphaerota archaeon]|nr:CPBP family intramembrane metalloprotease [Thermoproteota archaeon]MCR8472581.1 CPBP family intramembrane metalloprotease [Thermoproteota archaeon]MCR8473767.1 CPBP family intramembrane metalloprotease [Thermoproteota archaeon]
MFIKIDRNTKLYLICVFVISYILEAAIILENLRKENIIADMLMLILIFIPAAMAGIMVNILNEMPHFLRIRIRNSKFLIPAYVYPATIVVLAAALSSILGINIDWSLTEYKIKLYWMAIRMGIPPSELYKLVLTITLLAPIAYALLALGEEIGWRGYLLDKLLIENSLERTILFIGAIWAIWHAPLIIFTGYNYKNLKALGLLLFIPFCIAHGAILTWLRMKTGSVLAPALGHGAINAFVFLSEVLYPGASDYMHLMLGIPGVIIASVFGFLAYKDLARDLLTLREFEFITESLAS